MIKMLILYIQNLQIMKMDKDFFLLCGQDLDKCYYIWLKLFMKMKNTILKINNMTVKHFKGNLFIKIL